MADLVKKGTEDAGLALIKDAGMLGINRGNNKYCPHNLSSTCSGFSLDTKKKTCANYNSFCPTALLISS